MAGNILLASAIKYATAVGWPVFPLKPRGKEPLTKHGFQDATRDERQIRQWWKQHPNANIGTPTGRAFWVLDEDPRHHGDESLESLELKHGRLPSTIQQQTGSGGRHFAFAMPDQVEIRCGTLADGLDYKGTGGYIVLAPSIHPNGKTYIWDGLDPLEQQPILPAPGWLLGMLQNGQHGNGGIPFEVPPKIEKGRQHRYLVSIGGSMRARGLGFDEIFAALKIINEQRCTEPGPLENIRKIAESICRYPPGASMNGDDAEGAPHDGREEQAGSAPRILTCGDLLKLEIPPAKMLFDGYPVPAHGLSLTVAPPKAGKTVLGVQQAIAIATGRDLFDAYRVLESGPVLIVEVDDPAGAAGIKPMVELSGCGPETPLYFTSDCPIGFGPALGEWLGEQILKLSLRMVVIDSYTSVRSVRSSAAGDIVKIESSEMTLLDDLGKRLRCAIVLIHHGSKTAAGLDWTMSAAGTYAMFAGSEALIHISRFSDLDGAPERLVRIRGRRAGDLSLVLRFAKQILGYQHVIDGQAAPLYPLLKQIQAEFGDQPFGIRELISRTGLSRTHAYRQVDRLRAADAVVKCGAGQYALGVKI
jgi:hypothetical protein